MNKYLTMMLGLVFIFQTKGFSNTPANEDSLAANYLKVNLVCGSCYLDYLRSKVTFVNFVRDPKEADVVILVTVQPTGGGGRKYTLSFLGQKDFSSLKDTINFFTQNNFTDEQIRNALIKNLQFGLVRYVVRTPAADNLTMHFKRKSENVITDNWNNWVFNTNLSSYFSGEQSRNQISLYGSISAKRETEYAKFNFSIYDSYNQSKFDYDNSSISNYSRSQGIGTSLVLSAGSHWSYGGFLNVSSSTYSNIKMGYGVAPAVEFDIFPYEESTEKELRFLYRVNADRYLYDQETIYNKLSENLLQQSLAVTLELTQIWGSISTSLEGANYFEDFSKNHFTFSTNLSVNVAEGLAFHMYGNFGMIHDQLSLPSQGATEDEVLLQARQLSTQYSYYTAVGISYTFGSIYNNVVNPRFGI